MSTTFYSPAKKLSKISKMEKSINLTPKLVILIVTIIIIFNHKYDLKFSNQKSPSHNSQSTAGTFLTSAPPSCTKISPPPPNWFDWFCRYNLLNRKLYRHIILFSPTNTPNLNYCHLTCHIRPKSREKAKNLQPNWSGKFPHWSNSHIKHQHNVHHKLNHQLSHHQH